MSSHKYIKDYPRPQAVRDAWTNLNGIWDFCFDDGDVGERAGWHRDLPADRTIRVPFTYETKASGIGDESFHPVVWYRRTVHLPPEARGKRVKLHFQASDYLTKVWVNGVFVGMHEGGYAAFSFDITEAADFGGPNVITVRVEDSASCMQPRGKQRWTPHSFGCWYVQTTGIWQAVWLEYVNPEHIARVKTTPDIDAGAVRFEFELEGVRSFEGLTLQTTVRFGGRLIRSVETTLDRPFLTQDVSVLNDAAHEWKVRLWSPESPQLYDAEFVLKRNGRPVDTLYSYFGMRKISIHRGQILLNNAPLYQRLLLDQGYWEDTHLTPPSEEALIEDIEKTLQLGFNGVRKHQKVEDPRFLYWCDRKGLLVWSEMAAAYEFSDDAVQRFTREWMEIVRQHYNHPCIIVWTPFNESWGVKGIFDNPRQQRFTEAIYYLTKSFDPMRPVIVNDGWEHTVSDIITLHDYEEDGAALFERYKDRDKLLSNDIPHGKWKFPFASGYGYRGQPVIISEYGGIAFRSESGWGYGRQVADEEEFIERFRKITRAIKDLPYVVGYCYTQLSDVQQEVNGLMTAGREVKVNPPRIREINLS